LVDQERIEAAVTELILALGENPQREGLLGTPRRIAEMYRELFEGISKDPREELLVGFEEGHHEMVVLRDISFHSMCEHHLLPFFGVVHVGYIPNGRVVGISKIARVVEILARRPQLQERFTSQIADTILDTLQEIGRAHV
jgi:GTP cyclohydrolase IA